MIDPPINPKYPLDTTLSPREQRSRVKGDKEKVESPWSC